ncbi:hypothetical protein [Acetobacter senegalensis]|uniref:hypothetical protein n=1 Tax=Acetobacter senegalensis TaxID=446692 RepID=UPI0011212412|nr:hypothetical protein [Acetobacter senegalensis]
MQIEFNHKLDTIIKRHFETWFSAVKQEKDPNTIAIITVLPSVGVRPRMDGSCFTSWNMVSKDFVSYLGQQGVPFQIIAE